MHGPDNDQERCQQFVASSFEPKHGSQHRWHLCRRVLAATAAVLEFGTEAAGIGSALTIYDKPYPQVCSGSEGSKPAGPVTQTLRPAWNPRLREKKKATLE